MNSNQVKDLIAIGINTDFSELFIEAEQVHKKPNYPFATFQVIMAHSNEYEHDNIKTERIPNTVDPNFNYDIRKTKVEQPQMTMSINAYSLSAEDANDLAQRIKDWLDFKGDIYLSSNNITVIESEDITQRDILIVDNYERRYGFDVRLRYSRDIDVTIETIENTSIQKVS